MAAFFALSFTSDNTRLASSFSSVGLLGSLVFGRRTFIDPNLVATGATHDHRRMDRFALCFVFMAGKAS
jgi:hypothetical protein